MCCSRRWTLRVALTFCALHPLTVYAQAACDPALWSFLHSQEDLTSAHGSLLQLPPAVAALLPSEEQQSTIFLANDNAFQAWQSVSGEDRLTESQSASLFLFNSLPIAKSAQALASDAALTTRLAEVLTNSSYSLRLNSLPGAEGGGVSLTSSLPGVGTASLLRSAQVCGSWVHVVDALLLPPPDIVTKNSSPDVLQAMGLQPRKGAARVVLADSNFSDTREDAGARGPKLKHGRSMISGATTARSTGLAGVRRMLQGRMQLQFSRMYMTFGGVLCGVALVAFIVSLLGPSIWRGTGEGREDKDQGSASELGVLLKDATPSWSDSGIIGVVKEKGMWLLRSKRRASPTASGSSQAATGSSTKSAFIKRGHSDQHNSSMRGFIPSLQLAEQIRQQSMASCESLENPPTADGPAASSVSLRSSWEMNSWELDPQEVQICLDSKNRPWQLGCGGFGRVFRAEMAGSTPVAVKFVTRQSPRELKRFVHEIGILKSMRHTNIVQFLGAFMEGGQMVLVTEYMVGGDLYNVMGHDLNRSFGWYNRGQQVALDVVRGVVHMHARKVIHLDLKSANILLARDGTAKIADVGLAKVLSRENTQVSMESTFDWAAPEVLAGSECSEKADIWSLGVVLWEIASGEAPKLRQLRPLRVPEECPEAVRGVIMSCRASNPADRPTAREVFDRLAAAANPDAHRAAMSNSLSSSVSAHSCSPRPSWAPPEHSGEASPSFMASINEANPGFKDPDTVGVPRLRRHALAGLPAQQGGYPYGHMGRQPPWISSEERIARAYKRSSSL